MTASPQQPSTVEAVQTCPVCMGRGFVSGGFYGTGYTSGTTLLTETCKTCNGATILTQKRIYGLLHRKERLNEPE